MTDLGQKLKEIREEKGIKLSEIQEKTKIQIRYLEAIEKGNYSVLPGEFYVKAFIRQYAEAIEVSYEDLTESKNETPKKEIEEENTPSLSRIKNNKVSFSFLKEYLPIILISIAIILSLLAVWLFLQRNTLGRQGEPNIQNEEPTDIKDDVEDSPLTNENTQEENGLGTEEETEESREDRLSLAERIEVTNISGNRSTVTLLLEEEEEFILTLSAIENGESYVRVRNNEGIVFFEGIVRSGDTAETVNVSNEDIIELNIGFSPHLNVEINDEQLEYPINPSERDHQFITIERQALTQH